MKHVTLTSVLVLSLAACRPGQPCPSCEGDDDQPADLGDDEDDIPDLPCGGADLQTDDFNCGECGNVCPAKGSGAYKAGGCVAGVCGPNWFGVDWLEPTPITCDEVCGTLTCQPKGCSERELTGFVCEIVLGEPCGVFKGGGPDPLLDFEGACDEPVPWPEELEFGGSRSVYCCCG